MKLIKSSRARLLLGALSSGALVLAWGQGCVGALPGSLNLLGFPVFNTISGGGVDDGGGGGDDDGGGDVDEGDVDPCDEPLARKFVTISMQNRSTAYIHYFFIAAAFIRGEVYPTGGVCEEDRALYTQAGYTFIPDGTEQSVGNFCIAGPALLYFHRSGQFRSGGGTSDANLASAIAPAQGTSPSFDNFFTSAGARIPIPDIVVFHNPGTGAGGPLRVSPPVADACQLVLGGLPNPCTADSFYYVRNDDRLDGSTALGQGSGRRVPNEIQGTGCSCGVFGDGITGQVRAESGTGTNLGCNEFPRGGRIEYAFLRDDQIPAVPQLLWRVTESGGAIVHDFEESSTPTP